MSAIGNLGEMVWVQWGEHPICARSILAYFDVTYNQNTWHRYSRSASLWKSELGEPLYRRDSLAAVLRERGNNSNALFSSAGRV
jgi:hypothetical protein